jgi:hypothetical protein
MLATVELPCGMLHMLCLSEEMLSMLAFSGLKHAPFCVHCAFVWTKRDISVVFAEFQFS